MKRMPTGEEIAVLRELSMAARLLIMGESFGLRARNPRLDVVSGNGMDDATSAEMIAAVRHRWTSIVFVEFRRCEGRYLPAKVNVFRPSPCGGTEWYPQCALWAASEGPLLVVPLDPTIDAHFLVDADGGLERRAGRPASDLETGIELADARLLALAETSPSKRFNKIFMMLPGLEAKAA